MRAIFLTLVLGLLFVSAPAPCSAELYADFDGATSVSKWQFLSTVASSSDFNVTNGQLYNVFTGDADQTTGTYTAARLATLPSTAKGVLANVISAAASGTCEAGLMGSLSAVNGNTFDFYIFLRGATDKIVWGYTEYDTNEEVVTEFSYEMDANVLNTHFSLGLHYNEGYLRWGILYPDRGEWTVSQLPHNSSISGVSYYQLMVRRPTSCTTLFDNVRTIE